MLFQLVLLQDQSGPAWGSRLMKAEAEGTVVANKVVSGTGVFILILTLERTESL